MKDELVHIIEMEAFALTELLNSLEKQHALILKDDVFGLEKITETLELQSKEIAKWEVQRRELVKDASMREVVQTLNDKELDRKFREIKKLIDAVRVQRETNELLIKQGLSFTNKILGILNPNRNAKTYNSYGKIGR